MNVFDLRDFVTEEYERFSRGYSTFRADDIKQFVDNEHKKQRYWPAPLVQINPHFQSAATVEELVKSSQLHSECANIFRFQKSKESRGHTLKLHRHQLDAISIAAKKESYVLTTGTGSGKSLSYFIPIIDEILKQKEKDPTPKTRAIIIYPMNALANSQLEELEKFFRDYGDEKPVSYARYTGQEAAEERERIASNPPDILLTNFMMLELLLIRQDSVDQAVIRNAEGLEFLVLDELHTYRGRQGADVALLIRRVRERLNPDLLCIGTSATMATEGTHEERNRVVAEVSSRLFGAVVPVENIITETLERATDTSLTESDILPALKDAVNQVKDTYTYEELYANALAVWVELNMGLSWSENKWVRAKPVTIEDSAKKLAKDAGISDEEFCQKQLSRFLLAAYQTQKNGRSFFAFRLHQFISGAGDLYATLERENKRYLTLDGQQFVPGERDRRLFQTYFCRECGQEYFPVWHKGDQFEPRSLDETLSDNDDDFGYFMPDEENIWSPDIDNFPENWVDYQRAEPKLKRDYAKKAPVEIYVRPDGNLADNGLKGWYLPGKFGFCLRCGVSHSTQGRDATRLSSLSGEGRSTATTILSMTVLRYFFEKDKSLPPEAKKLLGFTDNRQDAALQSGHFNDFIHILLLRASLIKAMAKNANLLTETTLAQEIFTALGFDQEVNRGEFTNPEKASAKGQLRRRIEETMRNMLGYRLYFDLRRGWRINNPNLEQLGLLHIEYADLDEVASDESEWQDAPDFIRDATPEVRRNVLKRILDTMRQGLAIKTRYLDAHFLEQLKNESFANLKEPWSFTEDEEPVSSHYFFFTKRPKHISKAEMQILVSGSSRSKLGRELKKPSMWGAEADTFERIADETYPDIMNALLQPLINYGIIEKVVSDYDMDTYQINGSAIQWQLVPEGEEKNYLKSQATNNPFFQALYRNIAKALDADAHQLFKFESREHTAQVDAAVREDREERFRKAELPVLFCSPTMELGVDIATLNSVYMRNVPPTPANYAQRSGRAGRSGQPALIITYCAAQSPHDQYFFAEPVKMVHGEVKAPTLDLSNQDLIKSHIHSVWLSETGVKLPNSVRGLLDLTTEEKELLEEFQTRFHDARLANSTLRRTRKIIEMLNDELTLQKAPWFDEEWLKKNVATAAAAFDQALNRWRDMYQATMVQMELSNQVISDPSRSAKERKEANSRYQEAFRQQSLLLAEKASLNSDFYTYRYLASQGFLPGYNFPRLPLMAYIPGRSKRAGSETYLTRPRFLALSEFGPFSLIYHEGSQYRVVRAMLTLSSDSEIATDNTLPKTYAKICPNCGYGHFQAQRDAELCIACGTRLSDAFEIHNLYRIDNVSTRRALRITADEEERMRQGYETQTTVQFASDHGVLQHTDAKALSGEKSLLTLQYAPSATVWRMNLGWRRRKERSILGFNIDPVSGYWTKGEEPDKEEIAPDPDAVRAERIVPYVEDRRNILIVRPDKKLDESGMVTLQYALKRGIESVFQLEESELMVEPLPNKENRNAILFYEASEGGAGVLTRLAHDPEALAQVAGRALQICHYKVADPYSVGTLVELKNPGTGKPICEAGCYKCLLSYYNQPDHDLIDRKHSDVITLLCALTNAKVEQEREIKQEKAEQSDLTPLQQHLEKLLLASNLPLPDKWNAPVGNVKVDALYLGVQVAFIISDQPDEKVLNELDALGYIGIVLPEDTSLWKDILTANSAFLTGAME